MNGLGSWCALSTEVEAHHRECFWLAPQVVDSLSGSMSTYEVLHPAGVTECGLRCVVYGAGSKKNILGGGLLEIDSKGNIHIKPDKESAYNNQGPQLTVPESIKREANDFYDGLFDTESAFKGEKQITPQFISGLYMLIVQGDQDEFLDASTSHTEYVSYVFRRAVAYNDQKMLKYIAQLTDKLKQEDSTPLVLKVNIERFIEALENEASDIGGIPYKNQVRKKFIDLSAHELGKTVEELDKHETIVINKEFDAAMSAAGFMWLPRKLSDHAIEALKPDSEAYNLRLDIYELEKKLKAIDATLEQG